MGTLSLKIKKSTNTPWRLLYTWDDIDDQVAIVLIPGGLIGDTFASFPLSIDTFNLIKEYIPKARVTDAVQKWADSQVLKSHITDIARSHVLQDARAIIDLPWANKLYNFQTTGAKWLFDIKRGILADDPGLGKTLTSLTAAAMVNPRKVLVVTLTSTTVQRQWKRTVEEWLNWTAVIADGTQEERKRALATPAQVYIIPVTMLADRKPTGRNALTKKENPYHAWLFNQTWDVIIVDEAHTLQNKDSAQSKGAARLKSPYLFMLTGTPLWNRVGSVWNLLKLISPEQYTSYWSFVNKYCKITETPFGRKVGDALPQQIQAIREELAPIVLRRTVEDVFNDLPEVVVNVERYELNPELIKILRTMKKEKKLVYNGTTLKEYTTVATILSDMRRLCSMPRALEIGIISSKDAEVERVIQDNLAAGRQMLIFTWHRKYCEYVHKLARKLDPSAVFTHGETKPKERDKNIELVKSKKAKIFVATLPTLGVGVDLPMVDTVIFLESDYTPAMIEQGWRRVYRIGSRGTRFVYFVFARNTIEERIYTIFSKKKAITEAVLLQECMEDDDA